MKDFVKRNNEFFFAANQQVANWVGKISPLAGVSDSYMAFLQHKRNRIDGWATMWWAWTNLSREMKEPNESFIEHKQKVATIINTFSTEMETIHSRFENKGAFINYDFWINVESWTDELVSKGLDQSLSVSAAESQRKLRETLHTFWLHFLQVPRGQKRALTIAIDHLRRSTYDLFGFNEPEG